MQYRDKTVNLEKLIKYGFVERAGKFCYTTKICDGQFDLTITVDGNGDVLTELYDNEAEEVYILHLVPDACGEFVGRVRTEYEGVIRSVLENCFDAETFKQSQTKEIIEYVRRKYGDAPEFLWEKYPDACIVRRKDNRKWYALFMTVKRCKLGLDGDEPVEIIDLRFDADELPKKVDGQRYFYGYHMNKKHWITVPLDGTVTVEEIENYLDESYELAK